MFYNKDMRFLSYPIILGPFLFGLCFGMGCQSLNQNEFASDGNITATGPVILYKDLLPLGIKNVLNPQISLDGKRLIYLREKTREHTHPEVYLADIHGEGKELRLTFLNVKKAFPVFRPNDRSFAYFSLSMEDNHDSWVIHQARRQFEKNLEEEVHPKWSFFAQAFEGYHREKMTSFETRPATLAVALKKDQMIIGHSDGRFSFFDDGEEKPLPVFNKAGLMDISASAEWIVQVINNSGEVKIARYPFFEVRNFKFPSLLDTQSLESVVWVDSPRRFMVLVREDSKRMKIFLADVSSSCIKPVMMIRGEIESLDYNEDERLGLVNLKIHGQQELYSFKLDMERFIQLCLDDVKN